jgi:predicted NACHT family NTPase
VIGDEVKAQANPERYLKYWYEFCAYIDIRGLHVGSGKAHRFPIADLYIELDTTGGGKLKHTLAHTRRVVVGDPGSGKTTFLRRIVHLLAGDRLGISDHSAKQKLGLSRPLMPVFVSIAEWLDYVYQQRERKQGPTMPKDPQWLVHFLSAQSASREWGLDADWFKERLRAGECLLLFDGLDEAPDRQAREFATELLEAVAATWKACPILVTSRPSGYADRTVLPNFEPSHIESLNDAAVGTFLDRWSSALHPTDTRAAAEHRQELLQALNARPNIRRLARNTVMLTALAVVHCNEKRLPEQRAELYKSILLWLARSRELRPGRAGAERSLEILRKLALAMQNAEGGRKIQVTRHWAAEQIAETLPRPLGEGWVEGNAIALAEKFLEEEELDSGIIVRRGNELRFWHLSFQEYLAARAIGGLSEQQQRDLLLGESRRLYQPEWREVGQLLGGVLYEQGREKVDGLIKAVLDELLPSPPAPLPQAGEVSKMPLAPAGKGVGERGFSKPPTRFGRPCPRRGFAGRHRPRSSSVQV